jgi:hypothetical protein
MNSGAWKQRITDNGECNVDIKLSRDEIAIVAWIYGRARGFDGDAQYWANAMKKELGLSGGRYRRAVSFLSGMKLVAAERGKIDKPQPEQGDLIQLTAQGLMSTGTW